MREREEDNAFLDLKTWFDLFDKAEYEYSILQREHKIHSYLVFNLCCTINHLWDWAKRDPSIPNKDDIPSQKTHKNLKLISDICNRAKHFEKKVNAAHTSHAIQGGYGYDYGVAYGSIKKVYHIIDNNEEIPLLEVIDKAMRIWRDFANQIQSEKNQS